MNQRCRSPDHEGTARASMGGWGLGAGAEEKKSEDDDDDENLDWDQAQVSLTDHSLIPKTDVARRLSWNAWSV